jgi:hypothetical protein
MDDDRPSVIEPRARKLIRADGGQQAAVMDWNSD